MGDQMSVFSGERAWQVPMSSAVAAVWRRRRKLPIDMPVFGVSVRSPTYRRSHLLGVGDTQQTCSLGKCEVPGRS